MKPFSWGHYLHLAPDPTTPSCIWPSWLPLLPSSTGFKVHMLWPPPIPVTGPETLQLYRVLRVGMC